MKQPNSQFTEILYDLIKNGSTHEEARGYHVFRHYISKIKREIKLTFVDKKAKNKFGRARYFRVHILPVKEKSRALKLYKLSLS